VYKHLVRPPPSDAESSSSSSIADEFHTAVHNLKVAFAQAVRHSISIVQDRDSLDAVLNMDQLMHPDNDAGEEDSDGAQSGGYEAAQDTPSDVVHDALTANTVEKSRSRDSSGSAARESSVRTQKSPELLSPRTPATRQKFIPSSNAANGPRSSTKKRKKKNAFFPEDRGREPAKDDEPSNRPLQKRPMIARRLDMAAAKGHHGQESRHQAIPSLSTPKRNRLSINTAERDYGLSPTSTTDDVTTAITNADEATRKISLSESPLARSLSGVCMSLGAAHRFNSDRNKPDIPCTARLAIAINNSLGPEAILRVAHVLKAARNGGVMVAQLHKINKDAFVEPVGSILYKTPVSSLRDMAQKFAEIQRVDMQQAMSSVIHYQCLNEFQTSYSIMVNDFQKPEFKANTDNRNWFLEVLDTDLDNLGKGIGIATIAKRAIVYANWGVVKGKNLRIDMTFEECIKIVNKHVEDSRYVKAMVDSFGIGCIVALPKISFISTSVYSSLC
jgi:hypothetical protein